MVSDKKKCKYATPIEDKYIDMHTQTFMYFYIFRVGDFNKTLMKVIKLK